MLDDFSSILPIYQNTAMYCRKSVLFAYSVYKKLTAKKLSRERKTADIIFFDLH